MGLVQNFGLCVLLYKTALNNRHSDPVLSYIRSGDDTIFHPHLAKPGDNSMKPLPVIPSS